MWRSQRACHFETGLANRQDADRDMKTSRVIPKDRWNQDALRGTARLSGLFLFLTTDAYLTNFLLPLPNGIAAIPQHRPDTRANSKRATSALWAKMTGRTNSEQS